MWIIAAVSLAGLVLGVLALSGVRIELTTGQATLLISTGSLTLLVSLLLNTIHYKVDDKYLHLNIAFVDMLSNRIQLKNILNIAIIDGTFYISYIWKGPDPTIAAVVIKKERFEDMKELLMAKNPNIVYFEDKNETTDSQQQ